MGHRCSPAHRIKSHSSAQVTCPGFHRGGLPRSQAVAVRVEQVLLWNVGHPANPWHWAGAFVIHQLLTLSVTPAKG